MKPFEPYIGSSQFSSNFKKKRVLFCFLEILESERAKMDKKYKPDIWDKIWKLMRVPTLLWTLGVIVCVLGALSFFYGGVFFKLFSIINWLLFMFVLITMILPIIISKRYPMQPIWAEQSVRVSEETVALLEKSFENIRSNNSEDAKVLNYLNVKNGQDLFFAIQMLLPLRRDYEKSF